MYKVNYYTLSMIRNIVTNDYEVGNVKQYSDIFYTVVQIKDIPEYLQTRIDEIKGVNKYKPVITSIEKIAGHL